MITDVTNVTSHATSEIKAVSIGGRNLGRIQERKLGLESIGEVSLNRGILKHLVGESGENTRDRVRQRHARSAWRRRNIKEKSCGEINFMYEFMVRHKCAEHGEAEIRLSEIKREI
jgi:hypothetical protein